VLGVRAEAADEEIKASFRRLAKQVHPDLHPADAEAPRRFQELVRAYETLSDQPSRTAYDVSIANQRSLRCWRFRANAMTVVAAFALTVSVGLHWRSLSEAFLPAGEYLARLASNESVAPMSRKGEEVSTFMPQKSPQRTPEIGGAVANESVDAPAAPLPDETPSDEHVAGFLLQYEPQKIPSPQPVPSVNQATSDDHLAPPDEKKLRSAMPAVPSKTHGWATIRDAQIAEMLKTDAQKMGWSMCREGYVYEPSRNVCVHQSKKAKGPAAKKKTPQ
jgi:curved DNA-binding protein CbpA